MVLRREDDPGEAGFGCRAGPLPGVERRGVEEGGVGAARSPLGVGEGVDAEVDEEGHLALLPCELRGGGQGKDGEWGRRGSGVTEGEET